MSLTLLHPRLSLRGRARIFPGYYECGPWLLLLENRRKIKPKEIPSCLIPCLIIVFTPTTWNLSDNPVHLKMEWITTCKLLLSNKKLFTVFLFFLTTWAWVGCGHKVTIYNNYFYFSFSPPKCLVHCISLVWSVKLNLDYMLLWLGYSKCFKWVCICTVHPFIYIQYTDLWR